MLVRYPLKKCIRVGRKGIWELKPPLFPVSFENSFESLAAACRFSVSSPLKKILAMDLPLEAKVISK